MGKLVVAAGTAGRIQDLFRGLIAPEVIEAYDRLLASDGCAKDDADAAVGSELVRALTDAGMAHVLPHSPADPAWLRPASPDLALQGVLTSRQSKLAKDQELLLSGQRRLAEAQARYATPMSGKLPAHLVSVISDRAEISELSASLITSARKDWMTLENLATEMPLTEDFAAPPPPAVAGRVRCRSIYAAAMMDSPVARRIIRQCAEAEEEARLIPEIPMKLRLADHTTALLPLTPTGTAGALVVRAPVIVAALREYFELPAHDRLTPTQQKVLELMAEGLHDDAIARRAGVSTTSVRRHISAITDRLGVSSRFAAGAAAQRRGWIG